jgi:hypothetical protein
MASGPAGGAFVLYQNPVQDYLEGGIEATARHSEMMSPTVAPRRDPSGPLWTPAVWRRDRIPSYINIPAMSGGVKIGFIRDLKGLDGPTSYSPGRGPKMGAASAVIESPLGFSSP